MSDPQPLSCRICATPLTRTFVDLGAAPPCEAILSASDAERGEPAYPLHVRICEQCLLVQLPEVIPAEEIFTADYAYFSSYSTSWVEQARVYATRMIERLGLGEHSLVSEVASNDGYLLQHFRDAGIPTWGIEPTRGTAMAAIGKGIPTTIAFLGEHTGRRIAADVGKAHLVVANNVYAHVPDLADFTRGLAELLRQDGLLTLEVPHLMHLMAQRQYDTIYHEHFQYYTLLTVQRALALGGLEVVDVEELASHGGSLRVFAQHAGVASGLSPAVPEVLEKERRAGLHTVEGHAGFDRAVAGVKRDLLRFLLQAQEEGKRVVGYGAPGKGNTLLNHCGIRTDLVEFTVDRNPHKHGKFLPGSRIPVHPTDAIDAAEPDYVLVLPWNLRAEIEPELSYVSKWGGQLVYAVPKLVIVSPGN